MIISKVLIFIACATVAWTVFCVVIPWMAKLASLYELHNIRDEVYGVVSKLPAARQTTIYRDTEFLVTMAIHTVRERPLGEAVGYALTLLKEEKPSAEAEQAAEEHIEVWKEEMRTVFASEEGHQVLHLLSHAPKRAAGVCLVRVMCVNPVTFFVMVAAFVYTWIVSRSRSDPNDNCRDPDEKDLAVARSIPRMGAVRERSLFDGVRTLFKATPFSDDRIAA